MNQTEIKDSWSNHYEKIEELLIVNNKLLHEMTMNRSKSIASGARFSKYLGIAIGIPWVIFLDALCLVSWHAEGYIFLISIGAISIFTKIALGAYIYHLILLQRLNYAESVADMQKSIVKIKKSTLDVLRISVLQLPFWTTWYINPQMFQPTHAVYFFVNLLVTVIFTYWAIWLYRGIRIENMDRKWMKWLFSDREWNSVEKAGRLLEQLR